MYNSRSAIVLGAGISGLAAARLLRQAGTAVHLADVRDSRALRDATAPLAAMGCQVSLGFDGLPGDEADLCVVSPGINPASPMVAEARSRGMTVVGELELAAAHCTAPLIGLTGTNGKSTLASLCQAALAAAGFAAAMGGNCGPALSALAAQPSPLDWLVVEVSSFQLETAPTFRPRVGVVLNIQPDHLDRHGDLATYREIKLGLFANMGQGDTAIVHAPLMGATEAFFERGRGAPGQLVSFGESSGADLRYVPGAVVGEGGHRLVDLRETAFDNPILGLTAAAACGVMQAAGGELAALEAALRTFEGLAHRMQTVATLGGVRFIDDSKATNLSALEAALQMAPGPVRLIAGGILKEPDLGRSQESLAKHVASLYVTGQASAVMLEAWGPVVPTRVCEDLEEAVRGAWADAESGDVVLLSPGAASFDQFRNFEHRGMEFARFVNMIGEET